MSGGSLDRPTTIRFAPPALATLLLASPMPAASTDRLEPCPPTPNCVSTQATLADQRMEPIPFRDGAVAARERILALLAAQPRVRVARVTERRIDAVFTTRFLRFEDDVVFLVDPQEKLIHFRSASRIGRSDLGANRARMEKLSALLLEPEAPAAPPR